MLGLGTEFIRGDKRVLHRRIIGATRHFAERATSRLTRQVAMATLVIVLICELLVLGPLYQIQEHDLLGALASDTNTLVTSVLYPHRDEFEAGDLDHAMMVLEELQATSRVVGSVVSTVDGDQLGRFGAPMYHSAEELARPRRDVSGDYLEVHFGPEELGFPLQVGVRIDASWVPTHLAQLMWKQVFVVIGLSFLIALSVVTAINQMLVGPLLDLRASLEAAAQDPTNAASFAPNIRQRGVLGDLSRIIQTLFQRVSQTFREDLATFAGMVKQAGDGIFAYDSHGTLVYANQSILDLCGVTSLSEMRRLGGPLFRLNDADDLITLQQVVEKGSYSGEVEVYIREGVSRQCLMSGAVLKTNDGRVLRTYASLSDITAIREAQWSVEEKNRELEDANRIKSEFLAQMSHELRTPLNAIIGFSEILTDRPSENEQDDVALFAKDINNSGHHLLGVINNILDLSKMEAGKQDLSEADVDIQDLMHSAATMVRNGANSVRVNLQVNAPSGHIQVRCDPVRMKQVLLNLMSNAIKFTDPGGTVSLSAEHVEDGLKFTVKDDGIGMDQADVPRALQPFAQIDSGISRRYDGTGLGLPITAGIVELHGGTLEIQSARGVGTTVTFTIPSERLLQQAA